MDKTLPPIKYKLFLFLLFAGFSSMVFAQPLGVNLTIENPLCHNTEDGAITANILGGTPPYTFAWSNNGNSATLENLAPGTYTLTVTDAANESVVESATLTAPDQLTWVINSNYETCENAFDADAVIVNVQGGIPPYSFLWSTGDTTPSVNGLTAGTYTVDISDANGCSGTGSVTIEVSPEGVWVMPIATDVQCFSDSNGTLYVGPMTGTPPFSYAYSDPSFPDTNFLSGLAPGSYGITVTDANGCTGIETGVVEEPTELDLDLTSNNINCTSGASGSIVVFPSGGTGPYDYTWSTADTSNAANGLPAGTYSVTVSDANGCQDSITLSLLAPNDLEFIVSATDETCLESEDATATVDSVMGGMEPYTYLWSNGDTTATADSLTEGKYFVTVTDMNGCFGVDSIEIEISDDGLMADIFSTGLTCFGSDDGSATVVPLNGTAPYNYMWTNNQFPDTNFIDMLPSGIYSVVITDANGCSTVQATAVSEPPEILVDFQVQAVDCSGGNLGGVVAVASGGAGAPFSYAWNTGSFSDTLQNLAPGTYTLTVSDAFGCTTVDSVEISTLNDITWSLSTTPETCEGACDGTATVSSVSGGTPPYTYSWSTGDTTATLTGLCASTPDSLLFVIIEDQNGCTAIAYPNIDSAGLMVEIIEVDALCAGLDNGSLEVNVLNGTPNYTYKWVGITPPPPPTSDTATGLAPGTYSVIVTDANGCEAEVSGTIEEPLTLSLELEIIDDDCGGGFTGSMTALVENGTPPYNYTWNNGDTTQTIDGLAPGFYIVSITDANGCDAIGGGEVLGANPEAGTVTVDDSSLCLAPGVTGLTISATPNGDADIPAGYQLGYLLSVDPGQVIINVSDNPGVGFSIDQGGVYYVHPIVYHPDSFNLTDIDLFVDNIDDVASLFAPFGGDICADVDIEGAQVVVDDPDAGTLTAAADKACLIDGEASLSALPGGDAVIPAGYELLYVLTSSPGLIIEQVNPTPEFTVTSGGLYTIHTLVYDPSTLDLSIVELGVTPAADVFALLVPGGGDICADLDVDGAPVLVEDPDAGTLTADPSSVCLEDGEAIVSAIPNGDASIPAGYQVIYVLTQDPNLTIIAAGSTPSFTVTAGGIYTIHTLVYDPNTLDLTAFPPGSSAADLFALITPGGGNICADLDVEGAQVIAAEPEAGTITADADNVCLVDGSATISATPDGNALIPDGYEVIYVLTSGPNLIIEQTSSTPEFTVTSGGLFTIHTLVYDPNSLDLGIIQPGVTTGAEVFGLLVPGGGDICADLDVEGAAINVTNPEAGTITADADNVCLVDGSATLSATPDGNSLVPAGYITRYVLTTSPDLTIIEISSTPEFIVTQGGSYIIHTFVYDPATLDITSVIQLGSTTAFEVLALLEGNGGDICADLDAEGAPINVDDPEAGTITADASDVCLTDDDALLSASSNGDTILPDGYVLIYLLTTGPDKVIMATGVNPEFTVSMGGQYAIHPFVFNPDEVNLSDIILPGLTTIDNLLGQFAGGGGDICADVDVNGAMINVSEPDAGSLTADAPSVCLEDPTLLTATPNGDANVPAGYELIYVLTSGPDLIIEQTATQPSFEVSSGGLYTIHTLVYDPATLDLSIIMPGVTPAADVLALIATGGGDICADLDVEGAPINVVDPDAGSLSADASPICLTNDTAFLSATHVVDPTVPVGYEVLYVLTSGADLVIEQVNTDPQFEVYSGGLYTIHTLVYDPATLDLNIITFGVTTGAEVFALLSPGGGDICADLDVEGAPILVEEPDAGSLVAAEDVLCLFPNSVAELSASFVDQPNIPDGFDFLFLLSRDSALNLIETNKQPQFEVEEVGLYTIHTLIFDTLALDPDTLLSAYDTGVDLFGDLSPGGGDICGDLDVEGAPILVEPCDTCINIGDFVFIDYNRNGLQDAGEIGLHNVPVVLYAPGPDEEFDTPDDILVDFRITNYSGYYLFTCVAPGEYRICVTELPEGFSFTAQDIGNNDEIDSDVDTLTGCTDPFEIIEDQDDDLSYDIGVIGDCIDLGYGGMIGYNQVVCAGIMPDTIIELNPATGGMGDIEYLWMFTTLPVPFNQDTWFPIPNSNTPFFKPGPLFTTTYFIRCARREGCDEFIKESNIVVITVVPYNPDECPPLVMNMAVSGMNNGAALLNWTATNEMGNIEYYTEHSSDGRSFSEIGMVPSKKNGLSSNAYAFEHYGTEDGVNHYRVRVENNGHFLMYSDTVKLVMQHGEERRLTVYPNPFRESFQILSMGKMVFGGQMDLYSATGRLLRSYPFQPGELIDQKIDLGGLPRGLYMMRVVYDGDKPGEVIRLIKIE